MIGGLEVVNCQLFAAASGFPARSLAAVVTRRGVLRPGRQVGVGLKSSVPGPYQPKAPLTGAPSLVRFSEKAAWAEGLSIDLSKATTITGFGCTSVASSAGRTKLMLGGFAAQLTVTATVAVEPPFSV